MSSILKIEFWKDTGFQEGSVEVPSAADFLADPDYTYAPSSGNVKTSTEDFFSAFTIPVHFVALQPYSYIRVSYDYNVATPQGTYKQEYYGWIDDVSIKSDTQSNPSTRVSWHVDLWRTYLSQAQFGSGMVVRRPPSDNDPPNPVNAIAPSVGSVVPLLDDTGVYWALINAVTKKENKISSVRTMVYPVSCTDHSLRFYLRRISTEQAVTCPSWEDTVTSKFDEFLGVDPDTLISAYLSPVCPFGSDWSLDGTTITLFTSQETEYRYYTGSLYTSSVPYITNIHGAGKIKPTTVMTSTNGVKYEDDWFKWNNNHNQYGVADRIIQDWRDELGTAFDSSFSLSLYSGTETLIENTPTSPLLFLPVEVFEKAAGVTLDSGGTVHLRNVDYWVEGGKWTHSATTTSARMGFSAVGVHKATSREVDLTYEEWKKVKYVVSLGLPEHITYQFKTVAPYYGDVDRVATTDDGHGYMASRTGAYSETSRTIEPVKADDRATVYVEDFNRIPIAVVPWGRTVSSYTMRTVVCQSSAYLQFRLDGPDSSATGMEVTIPLPAIPITSNSWSSYVYSGARDADIAQRQAEAENALVSGVMSSLTGGASNAIMANIGYQKDTYREKVTPAVNILDMNAPGGMVRQPARTETVKVPGTGFNPLMAGTASIGIGVATTALEYGLTLRQNGILQGIQDSLVARQADNLITDGSGTDWVLHGRLPSLVTMVPDAYSDARWLKDVSMNGKQVSEMQEDCTSLVAAGGPLRISELVVKGPIPVQARAHIKGRFANGVRIRTINHQETEDR